MDTTLWLGNEVNDFSAEAAVENLQTDRCGFRYCFRDRDVDPRIQHAVEKKAYSWEASSDPGFSTTHTQVQIEDGAPPEDSRPSTGDGVPNCLDTNISN